jgi:hypothetical protein
VTGCVEETFHGMDELEAMSVLSFCRVKMSFVVNMKFYLV